MISSPDAAVRRRAIGRDIIMKTRYTVALSMIAGAALGATAIQGLHAQAKKAYLISLSDVADRTGIEAYNKKVREELTKAGGNVIILGGDRITTLVGTAPQRVGLTEFASVEKAQAWINSAERKALGPERDRIIKFDRLLIVEGN